MTRMIQNTMAALCLALGGLLAFLVLGAMLLSPPQIQMPASYYLGYGLAAVGLLWCAYRLIRRGIRQLRRPV